MRYGLASTVIKEVHDGAVLGPSPPRFCRSAFASFAKTVWPESEFFELCEDYNFSHAEPAIGAVASAATAAALEYPAELDAQDEDGFSSDEDEQVWADSDVENENALELSNDGTLCAPSESCGEKLMTDMSQIAS